MAEYAKKRSVDGAPEKMVAIETNGGVKSDNAFDALSITPRRGTSDELP